MAIQAARSFPTHAGRRAAAGAALLGLLSLLIELPLLAQDRLVRRFGPETGLVPPVHALAQDSTGFLWIGAQGGLFRYDGTEFRRWAADKIRHPVVAVAIAPEGGITAAEENGGLWQMTSRGARALPRPELEGPLMSPSLAFDSGSELWLAHRGLLSHRDRRGRWRTLPGDAFGGEPPLVVRSASAGAVVVATREGVWRIDRGAAPRKLFVRGATEVLPLPDGRVLALTGFGDLLEFRDGEIRELLSGKMFGSPRPRGVALAIRGGTIWASLDRYLVALRPGEAPDVLGSDEGIEGPGPLLVDHEGSLWTSSYDALFQYPEPETRIWSDRQGLPSRHTRSLARSGETLWVRTWQGGGYLQRSESGWKATSINDWMSREAACPDGPEVLWMSTDRGVAEVRGNKVYRWHPDLLTVFAACSPDSAGGTWIATWDGLLHGDARTGSIRRIEPLPFTTDPTHRAVLHDITDRLWITSEERICHAPVNEVRRGDLAWSCETLEGIGHFTSLVELPSGELWAGTRWKGVLAHRNGRWAALLSNDDLPTRRIFTLEPSPSGGIWMSAHGFVQRVRPDTAEWIVLERLGAWHGLPSSGGEDLLEDPDGNLWIATSLGIVGIPRTARHSRLPPPRVALVRASSNQQPLALRGTPSLPHSSNQIELRFAALSYRDPSLIRYQVRLGDGGSWSDVQGSPSFRWVDLRPGKYQAQVRASLDGERWSPEPASLSFTVRPPWYLEAWALALVTLMGVALLWAIHRARVREVLRLERQRTRIAMDLHDEVGSGLASIGILSGVLATDGTEPSERGTMAREIAHTAEELGESLSDIVWALDPHTATLEELASRLTEHGERLFPEGCAEFHLQSTRQVATGPSPAADPAQCAADRSGSAAQCRSPRSSPRGHAVDRCLRPRVGARRAR